MARNSRPFSGFEWMVAARYLRAKRQESFISVISGFSLIGIALGVATLIIVMSVMNGFRAELLGRILGLNGHLVVQSVTGSIPDYDALATRIRAIPGVTNATPIIEGQVLVNTEGNSFGALVRGSGEQGSEKPHRRVLHAFARRDGRLRRRAIPSFWARGSPNVSVSCRA